MCTFLGDWQIARSQVVGDVFDASILDRLPKLDGGVKRADLCEAFGAALAELDAEEACIKFGECLLLVNRIVQMRHEDSTAESLVEAKKYEGKGTVV